MITWRMRATVRNVHDGDTIYADLDQGLGIWNRNIGLRLAGINARELSEPGGKEARDVVAAMLPVGTVVDIVSLGWDKFAGRIDADVTLFDGRNLGAVLVEKQWAATWDGKGSRADHVPPWPRTVA